MEPITDIPPLIVIAGPTGSGKTSIAIRLAQQFNGEIICADSRTVYKGMDIGTAKPTKLERTKVAHHLIDVSTIDRPITAAEFKTLAQDTIIEVASRGKVPFLVGGTGLYIDAVIFNFSFSPQPSIRDRVKLEKLSVAELQERLTREGIALPENSKNKRHLVRRLEIGGNLPRQTSLRPNTLVLGLKIEREKLKEQISARLDAMLARGLESEVEYLADKYGWGSKALQTIGYQEFKAYFDGSCDLEGVRQAIKTHSLQYAKRQKTWFKRNKHMHYIRSFDEGADLVTTFLNKKAAQ